MALVSCAAFRLISRPAAQTAAMTPMVEVGFQPLLNPCPFIIFPSILAHSMPTIYAMSVSLPHACVYSPAASATGTIMALGCPLMLTPMSS